MAASRSASATSGTARVAAVKKSPAPAPKKAAAKTSAARAASTADSLKAAEMLREIQIDGEALSAQIERLRHRFL